MNTSATLPYRPDTSRSGSTRAFVLAVGVHCLLFAFLYFGIRWQSRPPAAIEAELWTELPSLAAPLPAPRAEPPPAPPKPEVRDEPRPPPKPDIAIREEKKKPAPKEKPAPTETDDPVRRDLLKELLAREAQKEAMAQKAASDNVAQTAAQAAAQGQRAATEWAERIKSRVRGKIPYTVASAVNGNPEAVFEVTLLPGLEVGTVRALKSSGNPAYDEAAERAIRAASPLPPPGSDRVAIPRVLTLRMRPKDE